MTNLLYRNDSFVAVHSKIMF